MTDQDPPDSTAVDVEAFFEGVPELRAYLERHIHDPVRRRGRLRRIAQELLKPRSARVLAAWLGEELRPALGAEACEVWLQSNGDWRPWYQGGHDRGPQPTAERLAGLEGPTMVGNADDGLLVPLPGLEGTTGAIWLKGGRDLDDDSRSLLLAIAGTAGMVLEQALRVEALARDPATGLLSSAGFIEQAGAELRQKGSGLVLVILGLRLSSHDRLPRVGAAARDRLGPGTPITVRSNHRPTEAGADLFAVPAVATELTSEREAQDLAAGVAEQLQEPAWRAVFAVTHEPIDDLATVLVELSEGLDETEPGEVRRLQLE